MRPLVVVSAKGTRKEPALRPGTLSFLLRVYRAQGGSDLTTTFLEPGPKNGKNLNNAWGREQGTSQRETKHNFHCK